MTALSDSKLSALETLTGSTGAVQDLEAAYLVLLGATPSTIYDMWAEVFDNTAIPAGQFNDRFYAYMDSILAPATEDHYNDREREYWDGGGTPIGPPLPPGSPLQWWDASDISQLFQDVAGLTPVTANGQVIRRINNKGSQATPITNAGADVLYDAGFQGGRGGADFTLNTSVLHGTSAVATSAPGWTMAVVAELFDPTSGQKFPASWQIGFDGWLVLLSDIWGNFSGGGKRHNDSNIVSGQVWGGVIQHASATTNFYSRATPSPTILTGTTVFANLLSSQTMGMGDGAASGADFRVGDYLVWDGLEPVAGIESWLAAKWGLVFA